MEPLFLLYFVNGYALNFVILTKVYKITRWHKMGISTAANTETMTKDKCSCSSNRKAESQFYIVVQEWQACYMQATQ